MSYKLNENTNRGKQKLVVVKNFLKKDLFVSVVELLDDVTSGKLIW